MDLYYLLLMLLVTNSWAMTSFSKLTPCTFTVIKETYLSLGPVLATAFHSLVAEVADTIS